MACHVRITEVIPIGKIVSSLRKVGVRTRNIVCPVIRGGGKDRERIAGLVNARATQAPPAGRVSHKSRTAVQAGLLIVEACREAVGNIPRRWTVKLSRILRGWIPAAVILGRRVCIGNVKESSAGSRSEVKGHGLIVGVAIVLGIGDLAKT